MQGFRYDRIQNSGVQCARDGAFLDPGAQFKVTVNGQPVDTQRYHCPRCNGNVDLQQFRLANGQVGVRQVRLTGNVEEFRPQHVRKDERMVMPVAYTLGSPTLGRVGVQPFVPPESIPLDPNNPEGWIGPNHPLSPHNLRARIQPISMNELF